MDVVVLILYTVAFSFQLSGAFLVVLDVRQAQTNLDQFKVRLDEAAAAKENHLRQIAAHSGRSYPGFGGGRIRGPVIPEASRDQIADQLGPSGLMERRALTEFVQAQYVVSKKRRWLGVSLLFIGVVAGYVASILSVL
ncbi:hypothetical protein CH252_14970 [Rhodococcus sp. 06-1477-1B]|nr:hypothetical protein CH252_14970 [Rhodococcus sp. 06-1477-1B]OZD53342.1 hypothetical protein CH266_04870 [Rhodococcus sp. 06-1474-1B]